MIIKSVSSEQASCLAIEAGQLIQRIADLYPKKMPNDVSKIRFPRGYISTCEHYRSRLSFVKDKTLKDNMADTMQMHDVFRWIFDQTDLSGPVRLMLIKEAVFIVASLCEAIVLEDIKPLGKSASFKPSTKALVDRGIITMSLKTNLDRIWDIRNRAHLDKKLRFTHSDIKEEDWILSTRSFRTLCKSLSKA
jgi:hypothetical protein